MEGTLLATGFEGESAGRRAGRWSGNSRRRAEPSIEPERAMCLAQMYFHPLPKSTSLGVCTILKVFGKAFPDIADKGWADSAVGLSPRTQCGTDDPPVEPSR